MQRREFLRTSCALSIIGSTVAGVSAFLTSCALLPVYITEAHGNSIAVPLSVFTNGTLCIIRVKNSLYDVALKKNGEGDYLAFPLLCTHASNPLTFTGDKFVCSLHGSTFDQKGNVTQGPAVRSLTQLHTSLSENSISISLSS